MATWTLLPIFIGTCIISCDGFSSGHLTTLHRQARQADGDPARGSCPHLLKLFRGRQTTEDRESDRRANERIISAQNFRTQDNSASAIIQEIGSCPTVPVDCDPGAGYRTPDGSCNNVENPRWGQAGRPQARLVDAAYADGLSDPRSQSVVPGVTLPNVRNISNTVHAAGGGRGSRSSSLTLQAFQMGQFLDHDIISTPVQSVVEDCCSTKGRTDLSNCDPIIIGSGDANFRDGYCMPFQRSAPVFCPEESNQREQKNTVTSFIDASNVYGSLQTEQNSLRNGALLKSEEGRRLPNNPDNNACLSDIDDGIYCSLAGDARVNVVPSLTTYHTLFVREHNRIARALLEAFPDEETLFQETRKIVAAVMQKIVYDEFLPSFLSDTAMEKYGLRSSASYVYDKQVNPTIVNGFGIAYRMGHTWIPRNMEIFNRGLQRVRRVPTDRTFLRPDLTYIPGNPPPRGLEGLAYWLTGDSSPSTDRIVEDAARNRLFIDDNGDALDLVSFNIQRGRDHGVPAYNTYRVFCNLPSVPADWSLLDGGNLVDHDADSTRRLREVYQSPLDIDLFTGALTELSVPTGEVGPTLDCILGEQFRRLKYGDRFWYQGQSAGFTPDQLQELDRVTMSRLLCDNFNFNRIHRNAFLSRDLVDCSVIPSMDLTKFGATAQPTQPPGDGGDGQRPQPDGDGDDGRRPPPDGDRDGGRDGGGDGSGRPGGRG